jgi:hypothetical protein
MECHLPVFVYVFVYVRMCVSLTPERLNGFCSYSVFKSLSIIGWRPVNINILALQIIKWIFFLKNVSNDFDSIGLIHVHHLAKSAWVVSPGGKYNL